VTHVRPGEALEELNRIREQLKADARHAWALEPAPPPPWRPTQPFDSAMAFRFIGSFALAFLWPLAIIPFAWAAWSAVEAIRAATDPPPVLRAALQGFLHGTFWTIVATGIALAVVHRVLRMREKREVPEDVNPDRVRLAEIMAKENQGAQNHLATSYIVKRGLLRGFLLRGAFWLIGQLVRRRFTPGFLSDIGTIHFARWVRIPGTRDLLFLSNYDGSWESYLEDFITRANAGLTGVWSNTEGYPATTNLFFGGASDGDRFKRWARRWQSPTSFWYSAYPNLATTQIRTNAAIRQGLVDARSEERAVEWLARFGSAPRPADVLQADRIQSLVFGGLGFLRHSRALLLTLPSASERARSWVGAMLPDLAFGDGRRHESAIVLALSPNALERLGLDGAALASFPAPFVDGMTAGHRSRVLGDEGADSPDLWTWGSAGGSPEAVALVYAKDQAMLDARAEEVERRIENEGGRVERAIRLEPLPEEATKGVARDPLREPFGFVDGISQPAVRGTYKALRSGDPLHLVEPGEFVLGYPDNRGYLPPVPRLDAARDVEGILPEAPPNPPGSGPSTRDLGRNGTFLVIRHFRQDPDVFADYCEREAKRIRGLAPEWKDVEPEFIAAKLLGRWKDGASLVRSPYESGRGAHVNEHQTARVSGPIDASPLQAIAPPPPALPRVRQTRTAVPAVAEILYDEEAKEEVLVDSRVVPDNDFLFGDEDPQGLKCPFGAHVRRANPRESLVPGSKEQVAITNRHRILRVGRMVQPSEDGQPGLFFMCLNADIERQFEFVQQTWMQGTSFHGLHDERDPILGKRDERPASERKRAGVDGFTIPTRSGPIRLEPLDQFVRVIGGGYFFLPSRDLLRWLAGSRHGGAAQRSS
jgi:deferrochelatase/peroxidase EfeB